MILCATVDFDRWTRLIIHSLFRSVPGRKREAGDAYRWPKASCRSAIDRRLPGVRCSAKMHVPIEMRPYPIAFWQSNFENHLKLCLGIAVGKGRQQTVGGKVLTGAHRPQVTAIQSSYSS